MCGRVPATLFLHTTPDRGWVFRDVSWYSPFCQTAATSGMSVLQASFVVLFFLQVLTETKVISHLAYCTEYIISHMFPLQPLVLGVHTASAVLARRCFKSSSCACVFVA